MTSAVSTTVMHRQLDVCDGSCTDQGRSRFNTRAADVVVARRKRGALAHAFTLIELMLVVSLMVILVTAVSVGMLGDVEQRYLDQGAERLESLLRMARADAANQGRRIRLTVDDESGDLVIQWEPQPLAQPGEFLEYNSSAWTKTLPNELVHVVRCQRTGTSALDTLVFDGGVGGGDETAIESIEFHPDGSSDSAIIELVSTSSKDRRHAIIELDGVNQAITVRVLAPSELAEFYEDRELKPVNIDDAF